MGNTRWILPCIVMALAWGCDSGNKEDGDGSDAGNGTGSGTQTPTDIISGTGTAGGSGLGVGNGEPEICDGIDNNADGAIDNLDAGNDGVCDCIRIATLGDPGVWGGVGGSEMFGAWLEARGSDGAHSFGDEVLTAEKLATYQVIIIQDVGIYTGNGHSPYHEYTADEVQVLADWVAAGGGLMTLIGYADPTEVGNVNALLEPLGIQYGTSGILGYTNTRPVTEWTATTGAESLVDGLTAIGVDNGYEAIPTADTAVVVATEDGNRVGAVNFVGKGHVFVWGDEWITYNSLWENGATFDYGGDTYTYEVERMWLNSLGWLTPANECKVALPATFQ